MATLTAAGPNLEWEVDPGQIDTRLLCSEAVYANQLVTYHATVAGSIIQPDIDAAAAFAGIALEDGAIGDVITVRQVGTVKLLVAGTFAATTHGAAAYGDTSTAANNNPNAIVPTATDNLPVGHITRVWIAGTTATVSIRIQADGYRLAVA